MALMIIWGSFDPSRQEVGYIIKSASLSLPPWESGGKSRFTGLLEVEQARLSSIVRQRILVEVREACVISKPISNGSA
jgi:hypothetical protein